MDRQMDEQTDKNAKNNISSQFMGRDITAHIKYV